MDAVRNAEMERAIDADPSDASFLVYADWLQSHGNPHGELIALDVAQKSVEANRLRERLAPQLLGSMMKVAPRLGVTWRAGFIEKICIATTRTEEEKGANVARWLASALALPAARFLRELEIGCPSIHEEHAAVHPVLVTAGVRQSLRTLVYTSNHHEEMLSWTRAEELGDLGALYPNLEVLEVKAGSFSMTAPAFPRLRRMSLKTCRMDVETMLSITEADWPMLEDLELWLGEAGYGGVDISVAMVAELLRSTKLPRLRSLGLCNNEITDELCVAIVESPRLPQLTWLDLSLGTMSQTGAQALIRGADRLRHLDAIIVNDNFIPTAVMSELRRKLPQVSGPAQRELEDEDEHRYCALSE